MAKYYLGLDIGGSKISGIVFDGRKVLRALTVPTPKNLFEFQHSVRKLVEFLSAGKKISALGVGQAGRVNNKSGRAIAIENLKFLRGVNLKKFYGSLGIKKVLIGNDAVCFTLAEAKLGKGKTYRNFIGLTLGTDIGGGIVIDRRLYLGPHREAGEAGHIMLDFKHRSGYYFQKYRDRKDFEKLGVALGTLFASLANLLDTEAIILGGAISHVFGQRFIKTALNTAKKHLLKGKAMPKILFSKIKHSGAVGAALLFEDGDRL